MRPANVVNQIQLATMHAREESAEVLYAEEPVVCVHRSDVERLIGAANNNARNASGFAPTEMWTTNFTRCSSFIKRHLHQAAQALE